MCIRDSQNIIDNSLDIQKQIGYLPELNPLYTDMKVHEYLKFHAEIRYIIGDEFNKALKRVVGECGLQGVVHRTIGNCSKGYKQRIGLAAAGALAPRRYDGGGPRHHQHVRRVSFLCVRSPSPVPRVSTAPVGVAGPRMRLMTWPMAWDPWAA